MWPHSAKFPNIYTTYLSPLFHHIYKIRLLVSWTSLADFPTYCRHLSIDKPTPTQWLNESYPAPPIYEPTHTTDLIRLVNYCDPGHWNRWLRSHSIPVLLTLPYPCPLTYLTHTHIPLSPSYHLLHRSTYYPPKYTHTPIQWRIRPASPIAPSSNSSH